MCVELVVVMCVVVLYVVCDVVECGGDVVGVCV